MIASPRAPTPNFAMPQMGADGLFVSINRGIAPAQITWSLRSAYNVAALNCQEPARTEITNGYGVFLKAHARRLRLVNSGVDGVFRQQYGSAFLAPREKYITELYNHYAFPPTLPAFCETLLQVSREAQLVKPADLDAFAARSLPVIEKVFDDFLLRYATYRADLQAWEAQYGTPVQSYPGGVTVRTHAP